MEILSAYIFAVKERSHLAKVSVSIQHNEIRTHTVYQNLTNLRAQMLDNADVARSLAKVNFLLNAASAGSPNPHAALWASQMLPAVAAPNDVQIANMLAGRAPN